MVSVKWGKSLIPFQNLGACFASEIKSIIHFKLFFMKSVFAFTAFAFLIFLSLSSIAQNSKSNTLVTKDPAKSLYLDIHQLEPGKVKFDDVAKAHARDLAVEGKYGVDFIKFWVNEDKGLVYCLSSSKDAASIRNTHAEAHGLLPDQIYKVTNGMEAELNSGQKFFLDIHYVGEGKVTAKDVAAAHQKDLSVQGKYDVNFINYWLDEKKGMILCLSQAPDSMAIIHTHKDAHGLLPAQVIEVKQGE
jgi:hypothetical protein